MKFFEEPWEFRPYIGDEFDGGIFVVGYGEDDESIADVRRKEYAERIVECVNACVGLDFENVTGHDHTFMEFLTELYKSLGNEQ